MVGPAQNSRDGFQKKSAEHELTIVDGGAQTIQSRHAFVLEAIRDVRFFEQRYVWTGTGVESDPVFATGVDALGNRRHRMHGPIIREGQDRIFMVDLGHVFKAGQTEEVEFTHTFIDVEKTFEPRLSTTTHNEMDEIVLRVVLPAEFHEDVFVEEIVTGQHGEVDRQPIGSVACEDNHYRAYEWRSSDPDVGKTYRLTWTM